MKTTVTATYQEIQLHGADQAIPLTVAEAATLLADLQAALAQAQEHPYASSVPAFGAALAALLAAMHGVSAVVNNTGVCNSYVSGHMEFVYAHRTFELYLDVSAGQIRLAEGMSVYFTMHLTTCAEWPLWEYITPASIPTGAARFVAALLDYLVGEPAICPGPAPEYPDTLTTSVQRALYDYLRDATTVLRLEAAIDAVRKDGWRGNVVKEREIKQAIYRTTGFAPNQVLAVFEVYRAHAA